MLWRRDSIPSLVGLTGLAFLLYASLSLLWSAEANLWPTIVLVSLGGSFAIGATSSEITKAIWDVFIIIIAMSAIPFSYVISHNYIGCAIALALAGAIIYKHYWFIPFALIGHAFTLSRGAVFASGVTLFILLYRYSTILTGVLVVAVGAVCLLASDTLLQSLLTTPSFIARLGVWQDTLNHLTIFGSGWGSFETSYLAFPIHTNMTETHPQHAYNDMLELLSELGVGTVLLWLFLILCLEGTSNLIVWTFLALGLSFFPLYIFPIGQLFALTLGQIYRERKHYGTLASNRPALPKGPRYGIRIQRDRPNDWQAGA